MVITFLKPKFKSKKRNRSGDICLTQQNNTSVFCNYKVMAILVMLFKSNCQYYTIECLNE